jgi:hypothetical protein
MPLIFKRPTLGGILALVATGLNVLQVIADQTHLMQPELVPLGYSLLEGTVVIASIALGYFAWNARHGVVLRMGPDQQCDKDEWEW